jgi:hypothetical protein
MSSSLIVLLLSILVVDINAMSAEKRSLF